MTKVSMARQNNLRKIRINEGLTVVRLAELSDTSEKTIRRIEAGSSRNSTAVTKHKIVNGLNSNPRRKKDYTFADVFPNDKDAND